MSGNKGKKALFGIIVLLAMAALVLPAAVLATPGAEVSIEDVRVLPDTTITLPIKVSEVTNLGAADIWLSYNKTVVEIDSITEGDLGTITFSINTTTGVARVVWFSGMGKSGNFTLANVTLHAVGSAGSTSPLTLEVKELVDKTNTPISPTVDSGVFKIVGIMEGDVSGDKHVSVGDAMLIAQYKAGLIDLSVEQLQCADTTDDGLISMADAMHIAQWLVDPDGSLGVLYEPLWKLPADDNTAPPKPL